MSLRDAYGDAPAGGYSRPQLERQNTTQMNQLNFRRLLREFKGVQNAMADESVPWLCRCEPVGDNLLSWELDVTFPEESAMQKSLNEYAASLLDETQNRLTLLLRFPCEFPYAPPELWVRRPRLKYKSAPVTFGGKVCNQLLTSKGWTGSVSIVMVLEQVRQALLEAGAEVDGRVTAKKGYTSTPHAIGLDRLSTSLFPTAGGFRKDNICVLSAAEAEPWVGDVSRLEPTDKIMFPIQLAEELYGNDAFAEGMMFEVKTSTGRKTHCALSDFVSGIPPDYALLPRWVMDELFIESRDMVSIRAVGLELCQYVKIQPHGVDFYEAVQQSGLDTRTLLTESLRQFSGLTESSSVPIKIDGKKYPVNIVELRPQAAVKIITHGEFEFAVDFDPAPDLEDDADIKKRQKELLEKYKEKEAAAAAEKQSLEDKRAAAIDKHYRHERASFCKLAGAEACMPGLAEIGASGDVEVALRLPGGEVLKGRFPEGASAAALYAFAFSSAWAEKQHPWSLQLSSAFPRKLLGEDDVVDKGMHRSVVSVREVSPPADDEELFKEAAGKHREGGPEDTKADAHAVPELDEEALHDRTTRAYEVQRYIRAGHAPEEAAAKYESGGTMPITAEEREAAEKAAKAAASASVAPAEPARPSRELQAVDDASMPAELRDELINNVVNFSGVSREMAENFLAIANWDVSTAINLALDEGA
eukprot:TRINITY_DN46579_c0_g1_i1.p1 TRINITY_DN46579_c0_g1~~TRINITY_DN46579_c0_g1_i1.p1  ORF type:complete len:701 (+),score=170.30 TRINITY_DN46579_c0_g1_i1:101-2203(+)